MNAMQTPSPTVGHGAIKTPYLIAGHIEGASPTIMAIQAQTPHGAEQHFVTAMQQQVGDTSTTVHIDDTLLYDLAVSRPLSYYGHVLTLDTTYAIIGHADGEALVMATVATYSEECAVERFSMFMREKFSSCKTVHIDKVTLLSSLSQITH
jgi:hypothetical protein